MHDTKKKIFMHEIKNVKGEGWLVCHMHITYQFSFREIAVQKAVFCSVQLVVNCKILLLVNLVIFYIILSRCAVVLGTLRPDQ